MTPDPVKALADLRALSDAATPGPWGVPMDSAPEDRIVPGGTDLHAVRESGPSWPGFFLGAVENKADAAFIVVLVNAFRADPAALLSPRDTADELAMKAEEYLEAVVTYLDPDNQFTHSRRRHVDRTGEELAELVAAILNRDTGSAEPEPEYTYDASCPHCRAGTPHHPIEAATEPTPETKE